MKIIQIYVRGSALPHTLTLDVAPTNTIVEVKIKIQEKVKLHPYYQRLFLDGSVLDDSKSLTEYEIDDESVLDLYLRSSDRIQVFIKTVSGRLIPLNLVPTDIVFDVKKAIQEQEENIHPYLQKLVFAGEILEDNRILSDYGIRKESVIHLYTKPKTEIRLYVKTPTGKLIPIELQNRDKVNNIKNQIEHKEGIAVNQQRLFFAGNELVNDEFISKYDIHGESTIFLSIDTKS